MLCVTVKQLITINFFKSIKRAENKIKKKYNLKDRIYKLLLKIT